MANEVHHISKRQIIQSGSKCNFEIAGIHIFKIQNVLVINI